MTRALLIMQSAVTVATVGAVGYVAYKAADGLSRLGGGLGNAAGDVGDAVSNITGTVASFTYPNVVHAPDPGTGPELKLRVVTHTVRKIALGTVHYATVEVTSDGRPVRGARVSGSFVFAATRKLLGTPGGITNSSGRYSFRWTVAKVPFTDAEDDVTLWATAPGFARSQAVLLE